MRPSTRILIRRGGTSLPGPVLGGQNGHVRGVNSHFARADRFLVAAEPASPALISVGERCCTPVFDGCPFVLPLMVFDGVMISRANYWTIMRIGLSLTLTSAMPALVHWLAATGVTAPVIRSSIDALVCGCLSGKLSVAF